MPETRNAAPAATDIIRRAETLYLSLTPDERKLVIAYAEILKARRISQEHSAHLR